MEVTVVFRRVHDMDSRFSNFKIMTFKLEVDLLFWRVTVAEQQQRLCRASLGVWISALVFSSTKDKVFGFLPLVFLAVCVTVAPGSSVSFPSCFHTFVTSTGWAWLSVACTFCRLHCVTQLHPNFPFLPLAFPYSFHKAALKYRSIKCPRALH